MKAIYFIGLLLGVSIFAKIEAKTINLGCFSAQKSTITIMIDNKIEDWRISAEENPDILRVFCQKKVNVRFCLSNDTIKFQLKANDTVNFVIITKQKDSAFTQVIGVNKISNSISKAEKIYHLSHLWSEVKYNFVNIDKIDFDWDSLYFAYISQVVATSNDYQYYLLLQRFLASLHDGHTHIFMPDDFGVFRDYAPIGVETFEKKVYITSIRKGIGMDSSFLGGEIIKIDNIPTEKYLQEFVIPYIAASTEAHLWMQVEAKITYNFRSKPLNIVVKMQNGNIKSISIQRNGEATRTANEEYWNLIDKKEQKYEYVQLIWLQDSILHLKINRFYPENEVDSLLWAYQYEIRKAKKLIIDLRSNGGGSTGVAWTLQSFLTKGKYFLNFGWQSRINDGVKKANGNWIKECEDFYLERAYRSEEPDTVFVDDTIVRWTMPTAILIGEYTFSAAEDFLINLYEVPDRPILIGRPTGGSTGSPLVIFGMPLDGAARLCTKRQFYPYSKTPFVNKGILPDIVVPHTWENYLSNKDIALEKAVEYLKSKEK